MSDERVFIPIVIIALIVSLVVGFVFIPGDKNFRRVGYVRIWTDPDSKCEYVVRERIFTPRLGAHGQPICGG